MIIMVVGTLERFCSMVVEVTEMMVVMMMIIFNREGVMKETMGFLERLLTPYILKRL